jgi:hypothetical protein
LEVGSHGELFDVAVIGTDGAVSQPDDVQIRCWPTTLSVDRAVPLASSSGAVARFEGVTFEALTTFLAVEVATAIGGRPRSTRFVLNLRLEGAPPDRRDRILRCLIKDKSRFARYLWMLLADESDSGVGLVGLSPADAGHEDDRRNSADAMPSLFELLLRTLDRHPQRLDDIAGLLKSVRTANTDGEVLFPHGFEEVWGPIWALRERAKAEEQR